MNLRNPFLPAAVAITSSMFHPAAHAIQNINEDLKLTDATPAIIFNDTGSGTDNWYLRGRDEYFSLVDVAGGTDVIYADPSQDILTFNYAPAIHSTAPVLLFNDTSVLDGQYEWYVRGRDEFFAITDVDAGQQLLFYDKGTDAVSFGPGAAATGADGVALGTNSDATASSSVAIGDHAEAGGFQSIAVGLYASAVPQGAVVIGGQADALDESLFGVALGASTRTQGNSATALGASSWAMAEGSVALGAVARATEPWTIVLGSDPSLNNRDEYHEVGIGTSVPLAPVHIYRDDGTARLLVQENHPDPAGRTLFTLANRGNTKFEIKETGTGTRWQFTNSGDAFRISKYGTGEVEFQVFNDGSAALAGDLVLDGSLTEMSDRNQKHAIVPLDGETVLAKVAQVPVSEWSYKGEAADSRHIGPMAQDFYAAFGLASGETQISARDMAGVNMAAIQALNQKLEQRNQALEERVVLLESLVRQLLPNVAAN